MHDLIIVGAGLTGLALARAAAVGGSDVVVLEARDRIGGRVLTHRTEAGAYDLGPAWIWPTMQPRIAHAARAAGLVLYEQTEAGGFVFQDQTGRTRRRPHGFAQEPPSMRINGGIGALIAAFSAGIDPAAIRLAHVVRRIALTGNGVAVAADTPTGLPTLHAAHVTLALPPRLIGAIDFAPGLPTALRAELAAVPTWMAGHAKAIAIFDRPVWRDQGLSGNAFSQSGPLGEIHDASLPGAAESALFGFFGWPASLRAIQRSALPNLVARQLGALFGPGADRPREVIIQDWATEAFTATSADEAAPTTHPAYRPLILPAPWGQRITLSSAELAPEFGGYLEGALAAADEASRTALQPPAVKPNLKR